MTFLSGHVTLPELFWTLNGLFGVWVTRKNLSRATERRGFVIQSGVNGDYIILVEAQIRRHLLLFLYSIIGSLVGFAAMGLPPAVPSPAVTPTAILLTVGIVLGQIIVNIVSYSDNRMTEQLEKRARLQEKNRRKGD